MRKHIYDKDILYNILRPYVDRCTRYCYNKVEVHGKENIPTDGAVIIAPNHCNTLMDALVILQSFKDESVFGARADMFNIGFIARIMYFLRILPMVRQRDGFRNVLKNYESIDNITGTLEHDMRFCIFPEGRHRPAHSLLPLGKGIFRAALAANAKFGQEKPVYIIPTGIEYGDHFRFRSTCLVNFGKAINVTEFLKKLDVENEVQAIEPMRKELRARMSGLKTFIENGDDFGSKWALTKILAREDARQGSLMDRMLHNRHVVEQIEKACEAKPQEMENLLKEASDFEKERRHRKVSTWSLGSRNKLSTVLGKGVIALLGIPYFIFASIASLPMWLTFELLRCKLKDRAFHNTAGFGLKLAMWPFVFIGWTIAAFNLTAWPVALLLSLLTIPAYGFFYDYTEFIRIFISDIRLLNNRKLRASFDKIRTAFSNI